MKKGISLGKRTISLLGVSLACVSVFYVFQRSNQLYGKIFNQQGDRMLADVRKIEDAIALFPKTVGEINGRVEAAIADAEQRIVAITSIEDCQRTFSNTVKAFDELCSLSNLAVLLPVLDLLEKLSPDQEVRDAAHDSSLAVQEYIIDHLTNNIDLYTAVRQYAVGSQEEHSTEEQHFLDETLRDFKRSGLDLPEKDLEEVKQLRKDLTKLILNFEKNITDDATQVLVKKEELQGLEEDFIDNLKQTEEGLYILTLDYPTYYAVMDNCAVIDTRKKMYCAFSNRAYPANREILKKIIKTRDHLAKKLGFSSFAALDLDNQMIKHPEQAVTFLDMLADKVSTKVVEEITLLTEELPKSVELSENGKLWPWDSMYLANQYKKKYLSIDETKLAEYFPMESTIKGLLDIYQQFLGVNFTEISVSGLWHEDVKCVAVSHKGTQETIGYLFLDLYPRPNKYSHPCQEGVVPATFKEDLPICSVAVVIANFPKATSNKPSLLKRGDVAVFFHEFGHALHELLGRTSIASFAGTKVKTDFVEMPSQMLEEWLWNKDILKMISCHYTTNECLPDSDLDAILNLKNFCKANWLNRQIMFSQMSLRYFLEGDDKDPYDIMIELAQEFSQYTELVKENHVYSSFVHLGCYGAKYYSYLWSKVFALDLFDTIKDHGLLDETIGRKYVQDVLSKGGSQDPNKLLENFLGRAPSQDAFLKSIGVRA